MEPTKTTLVWIQCTPTETQASEFQQLVGQKFTFNAINLMWLSASS